MKIFIDTNILRDYMENRATDSTAIVELARQKKWDTVTSVLAMMEIAELEKDTLYFKKTVINKKMDVDNFLRSRKQKVLNQTEYSDLLEYLNLITTKLPFLTFLNLSEGGWGVALELTRLSPMGVPDSIHLATAFTSDCDLLVTKDADFIKWGNEILETSSRKGKIKLCLPSKVEETAKEIGVEL